MSIVGKQAPPSSMKIEFEIWNIGYGPSLTCTYTPAVGGVSCALVAELVADAVGKKLGVDPLRVRTWAMDGHVARSWIRELSDPDLAALHEACENACSLAAERIHTHPMRDEWSELAEALRVEVVSRGQQLRYKP